MGKVKIEILLSHCRYFDKTFTEMFLEWSSTKHNIFVLTSKFDWLPWQQKGRICKKISEINSSETVGDNAETFQIVTNISLYKNVVFNFRC